MKRIQPNMVTKSSLMLGLGETDDEVLQAMKGIKHSIFVNQSIYNSSNTIHFLLLTNVSCQGHQSTTVVLLLFLLIFKQEKALSPVGDLQRGPDPK